MQVRAPVRLLSDGRARLETTMRAVLDAGRTAVPTYDNVTVVVMMMRSVNRFDGAMYYAVGLNPRDFDLIVGKSPQIEYHCYDEGVEKNFNIDLPGATSANIRMLGHTIRTRPMYPLEHFRDDWNCRIPLSLREALATKQVPPDAGDCFVASASRNDKRGAMTGTAMTAGAMTGGAILAMTGRGNDRWRFRSG